MRDVKHDFHPKAGEALETYATSDAAEVRQLARALLRRRRRVIDTGVMDADAIAHTLANGRVIYQFEQAGYNAGLIAFLCIKDEVFYLLSVVGYEASWFAATDASEKAYFQALGEAVRRIDEI